MELMYIQVCVYSHLHVIHGLNAALYVPCTIAFPLILNVVGQTIFYCVFANVLYRTNIEIALHTNQYDTH